MNFFEKQPELQVKLCIDTCELPVQDFQWVVTSFKILSQCDATIENFARLGTCPLAKIQNFELAREFDFITMDIREWKHLRSLTVYFGYTPFGVDTCVLLSRFIVPESVKHVCVNMYEVSDQILFEKDFRRHFHHAEVTFVLFD
jgi:hypothetical protein